MFAAELFSSLPPAGGDAPPDATVAPGHRQRRIKGPDRRSVHELKDPTGWPAEPAAPVAPLDDARFDTVMGTLCRPTAPTAVIPEVTRLVRETAAAAGVDPFLLGALVFQQSGCRPKQNNANGVGLLQIQPAMFDAGATLPIPRNDLAVSELLDPAHNLTAGVALLKMWQHEHEALDVAAPEAPHRTAVAHFIWGERVWGAAGEDRVLTARRRMLEAYAGQTTSLGESPFGFALVSPLDGVPRLGTSGPGEDRDGGKRAHRGLDIDAADGEPVHAIADGVVQFAGADMPGRLTAQPLAIKRVKRFLSRRLGPGGIFVRVEHAYGVRSGYFHLATFNVVPGQLVRAGDVIGTVGRSGVKVSPTHLHLEVQQDDKIADPARVLTSFVIPPEGTISHEQAMAQKKTRLAQERRRNRHHRLVPTS